MNTMEGTTQGMNAEEIKRSAASMVEWWRLDGAIEKVKGIIANMTGHRQDEERNGRGPADYEVSQDDVRKLMRGVAHLLARPPQSNQYNEGGGGSENALLKWTFGVLSTLAVSAVLGAFAMYGKLTAIEAGINGHEQRLDRLERINEALYRGGYRAPTNPSP